MQFRFFSQTSAIAGIQEENKNYRHSRAQLCNSRAQLCNDTFASASFKHNLKSNRLSDTQNIFAKAKYKGHIYNVSVNCSAGKSVRKIALNDLNLITFMFQLFNVLPVFNYETVFQFLQYKTVFQCRHFNFSSVLQFLQQLKNYLPFFFSGSDMHFMPFLPRGSTSTVQCNCLAFHAMQLFGSFCNATILQFM